MNIFIFNLTSCINPTDADTETQWEKTYGGSLDERGYSVEQTTDGGYITQGILIHMGQEAGMYIL